MSVPEPCSGTTSLAIQRKDGCGDDTERDDYDSELFLKAVKTFLNRKDKDMDFLFQYARMRKVEEKAYRILEAMDYED